MKKKILYIIVIMLLVITGCNKIEEKATPIAENIPLMEFDIFKEIVIDNVTSIDFVKYTVAGDERETITNAEEIFRIYNELKKLTIINETTKSCEDNTKIYTFNMNNGKSIKVELECNWVVIGNKHYEVK